MVQFGQVFPALCGLSQLKFWSLRSVFAHWVCDPSINLDLFFTSSGLRCGRASSQSWRWGEVGVEERCWVSQWHWGKNLVTLERGGRRLQRGEVHSSERSKACWASTLNQTKAALTRRVKDATRNQRIRNKLTWVSSRQLSRWLTWRLTADRRCWYASPVRWKCKN